MRKSYPPEIENQAISKYLLGESVRDVSESMGVSMGYVSNCIENFTSKMERGEINAIHEFFKIIKKTGLQPMDAFLGYAVFSVMSKHKLDANKMNAFVESVLSFAKENELSAEHLIDLCKKLSAVQSISGVALEELDNYCNDLLVKKKQLEEKTSHLDSQCKQSKSNLVHLLEQNNLAEKQIEMTVQTLASLKTLGFDISDLNSFSNAMHNAKSKKYNIPEIIQYLNQDKSLDLVLQEKQTQLDEIETKTRKFIKKHESLSLRYENLSLRHDFMLKSIKSVEHLAKNGVPVDSILVWQQIFDSFGIELEEFEKELKAIGDKKKFNSSLSSKKSKLEKDITHLEKKISWLEDNANNLAAEISNGAEYGKKNLKKITDHAESQISSTVMYAKKFLDDFMKRNHAQLDTSQQQFQDYFLELTVKLEELLESSHKAEHSRAKMESLKPLYDLINGKFDPLTAIPQVVIILDKLYVGIKNTNLDKRLISIDIKNLHEHMLRLQSHE